MKVLELYDLAFDENGNGKVCGREICKHLIIECQLLEPRIYFGNHETGMMEIDNIKNFVAKLKAK